MGAQAAGRKAQGRGRMAVRAIALVAAVGASGCALFGDYDFEGYRERPPETPGAVVLRGGFVGGAVQGQSNGVELRGRIVWHGSVRSTPNAQGIELVGWLR